MGGRSGPSGNYKTLVKWCHEICKKRVTFRTKERKQSGTATILPPTVLDTVADMWSSYKVATDLQSRQSAAQAAIIRDAATSTNPSLLARRDVIQAQRDARHRVRPPTDPNASNAGAEQGSAPPLTHQSPQTPSTAIPNRSTHAHEVREMLRRQNSSSSQGDIAQIISSISQQIVSIQQTPQTPAQPQPPQPAARTIRERLRELTELHDDGEITAEELAAARRDILRNGA